MANEEFSREETEQANRTQNIEPMMSVAELAEGAVYMACQPPYINVLEIIQLPVDQLYI